MQALTGVEPAEWGIDCRPGDSYPVAVSCDAEMIMSGVAGHGDASVATQRLGVRIEQSPGGSADTEAEGLEKIRLGIDIAASVRHR